MLAIVIPYFKRTFFEATLESLANQTDKRFKVYIGDDASPENPEILLKKFKGEFDFVYHRFENNLGGISLVKQWKRCIALSGEEEWIMILGDDDVLGEGVVEEFYRNLPEVEQIGINVVRFSTQVIDGVGKVISCVFEHPKLEKATDAFWRKFTGKTRSSLSEYVFKRSLFLKFGFREYPLAWHSDDMAWLEFTERHPIFSINRTLIYIRMSNVSVSGKVDNLENKRLASYTFYEDIADDYLHFFDKKQRIKLIAKLEQQFFKQKQGALLFKIMKHHLKHTNLIHLVKFFRRIYINI